MLNRHHVDVFGSNYSSSARDLVEHYNCGSLDETIFTRDSLLVSLVFLTLITLQWSVQVVAVASIKTGAILNLVML